jgi:hypothetical protein
LIDGVDTTVLDPTSYPIQVGDQLVSVDGTSMSDWINELAPYAVNGRANPVSTNRLAASIVLDRYQGWYPHASDVKPGSSAVLRIRSQTTGRVTAYTIPWEVIGTPINREGPAPSSSMSRPHFFQGSLKEQLRLNSNLWHIRAAAASVAVPRSASRTAVHYSTRSHVNMSHAKPTHVVAGSIEPFDSPFPLFNPPPGFKLRLGANPTDNFVSGSFPVGNKTIGFIRIPTFEPADEDFALQQFQDEVAWFQANTAGLVVDVMGNGGGDGCYAVSLVQLLETRPFWALNAEPRPSENWISEFSAAVIDAQFGGAPQSVIDAYQSFVNKLQTSLARGDRNTSSPLPLCTITLTVPPATDENGNSIAYTGPLLLLTDNFTLSSAEIFASELQDSNRATVYGTRTDGGGANVVEYDDTAAYSETSVRVSEGLIIRSRNVSTPGYPSAPYIENIGVYPDITADYQTRANLFTGGQPFVAGFSAAIGKLAGAKSTHP